MKVNSRYKSIKISEALFSFVENNIAMYIVILVLGINLLLQISIRYSNRSESIRDDAVDEVVSSQIASNTGIVSEEYNIPNIAEDKNELRLYSYGGRTIKSITVEKGGTLAGALRAMDVDNPSAHLIAIAVSKVYRLHKIRPGHSIILSVTDVPDYLVIDGVEFSLTKRGKGFLAKKIQSSYSNPERFMPVFVKPKITKRNVPNRLRSDRKVSNIKRSNANNVSRINADEVFYMSVEKANDIIPNIVKKKASGDTIERALLSLNIGDNAGQEIEKLYKAVKERFPKYFSTKDNRYSIAVQYLPNIEKRQQRSIFSVRSVSHVLPEGKLLKVTFIANNKKIDVYAYGKSNSKYYFENGERVITGSSGKIMRPLENIARISSGYGMRMHPIYKRRRMHNGIDYVADRGTNVISAGDGVISVINFEPKGFGKYIKIKHKGKIETLYAHLLSSENTLYVGKRVKAGDIIGKVGKSGAATGYHLHFEVHQNKKRVNPVKFINGVNIVPKLSKEAFAAFNHNINVLKIR